jgi:uncharacterized integral membrane protein
MLWWIILLPLLAAAAAFAVANRGPMIVSLDPLPYSFEAPAYVALMAAAFVGLIIGGISTWLAGRRWRRAARLRRRNIKLLEAEVESLRARLAEPVNPTATPDLAPGMLSGPAKADEASARPPAGT